VSDTTVRGLLISGARSLRGAIDVTGEGNLVERNVLAGNIRGIFLAPGGGSEPNRVERNQLAPRQDLVLPPNEQGAALAGDRDIFHKNFVEARNVGIQLANQGQSGEGSRIRGNAVTGNVVLRAEDALGDDSPAAQVKDEICPPEGIMERLPGFARLCGAEDALPRPGSVGILDQGVGTRIGGAADRDGNVVRDWEVGVEARGTGGALLGNEIRSNDNEGVDARVRARNLRIGGTRRGEGNLIAENGAAGVAVERSSRIRVVGNTIVDNQGGAIAGADPDVAELAAGLETVRGRAASGALVEAYVGVDEEGRGEARRFVGRTLAAGNGRFMIDAADLEAGERVAVTTREGDGTTSTFSEPVEVGNGNAGGGQAPEAPQAVTATGATGGVELDWNPVSGAAGYELHRLPAAGVDPAPETFRCVPSESATTGCVEVSGSSFTDPGLVEDVVYSYRVVAYDEQGRRSEPSSEVSAAATATSADVAEVEVNQIGDADTCPSDADGCRSLSQALAEAREAPMGPGGVRAVVTFDREVFDAADDGGPTVLKGCCLDLGEGGIVVDGDNRVALEHGGSQGPRGVLAGLDPARNVEASDGNVIRGLHLSGFGTAVSVLGQRNAVGQPGGGNVFEGNELSVDLAGSYNSVTANRIAGGEFRSKGAYRAGSGVVVGGRANRVGGTAADAGNVIVDNPGAGVVLEPAASDNDVAGNHIGAEPSGHQAGNLHAGVQAALGADGNRVVDNTIAYNFGPGVRAGPVMAGALEIAGNPIHTNGGHGIAVTEPAESCDERLTPAPELDAPDPEDARVTGTACPGARVEVFGAAPDGTGAGQGRTPLGTATAGDDGRFAFTDASLARQRVLTATATRDGATSPFAVNVDVPNIFPPEPVADLTAEREGDRAVELAWSAVGQGPDYEEPAQRYEVRQATEPLTEENFESTGRDVCGGDECVSGTLRRVGDPVTFEVEELLPGQTYYWGVRAVGDDGLTGPVSNVRVTLEGSAAGVVDDLEATVVSPTEVRLTFSAVGQNGSHPPPVGDYVMKKSQESIGDVDDFDAAGDLCEQPCEFEPGEVGEELTLSVSGLEPGASYSYAVRARDEEGTLGPLSNVATASMPAGTPGTVDDLDATAVSGNEILLRFSAVGADGDRPPPVGDYVIKQSREPIEDASDFEEAFTLCGGVCSFEPGEVGEGLLLSVTDLSPGLTYYYAVAPHPATKDGDSTDSQEGDGELNALSNSASATTLEATPGAITDLTATEVSDTEVELSFSAVGSDGDRPPPVGDYLIRQSTEPIEDASDFEEAFALCGGACSFQPEAVGDELTLTITDLDAEATYSYAIRARNEGGSLGPLSLLQNPIAGAGRPSSTPMRSRPTPMRSRPARPVQGPVVRRAGPTRWETAAEISRAHFPQGSETVVIARGDGYADALAGASLARAEDAPLLLALQSGAPGATVAEAERLGADRALLLGGRSALGEPVEAELRAAGIEEVERVAGEDRFATAAGIAQRLNTDVDRVLVAEGVSGWPDALAAASLSAYAEWPILLVTRDGVPEATAEAINRLEPDEALVIGGPAAVSDEAMDALGIDARRVAGANRFATADAVRDEALAAGMSETRLWLATGHNFPDALAGGPGAAARGAPLLLVDTDDLASSDPVATTLAEAPLTLVTLLGGEAAISSEVEQQVREMVEAS
jgi:putative cell wall-binding protein/chitodextrinase